MFHFKQQKCHETMLADRFTALITYRSSQGCYETVQDFFVGLPKRAAR